MKVLLHCCCGPCTIYPLEQLKQEGMTVMGFFYRHNIHPFTECMRRQETLETYAETQDLKVIVQQGYALEHFLRAVAFRESDRCRFCYHDRLRATAKIAKKGKFDGFTTTLLYSKFQNHRLICETAEAVAKEEKIPFIYRDFREGWKQGIERSKQLGMYRQQYCGCIYSERDRFFND